MSTSSSQLSQSLTGGRMLARNTVWNLLGQLLPMIVGIIALPPIVRGLGVDRLGLLSIAWLVIGYFSLFDLGIGRALTKLVSDRLASHEHDTIPSLAWTSIILMLGFGVAGGITAACISPWLVHRLLKIPTGLESEALASFLLLAVSIPVITTTSGFRGILEAQQRFAAVNLIRVPMSIFSFLGPLLALPFVHSLVPIIALLVAGRAVGCAAHLIVCLNGFPALRSVTFDRRAVVPVLSFGGWMTVSNVVGPLMVYMDRLLIGSLLSVSAVAYYTTPFDLVTRLTVIPAALTSVLFPAFAASLLADRARTRVLLDKSLKYLALLVFPFVFAAVTFAPEILNLWLGPVFAAQGASVLRWLAVGVFFNSIAQIPFALIQSAGRPDLTAKLHLIELPGYGGALVWFIHTHGIEGAALAWTLRSAVDSIALLFLMKRTITYPVFGRRRLRIALGGLLVVVLAAVIHGFTYKVVFFLISLSGFASAAWYIALSGSERQRIQQYL